MCGTTSMWSISTVVPLGGALPLKHRRGIVTGSEIKRAGSKRIFEIS